MSRPHSYAALDYWRKYLPFLPEVMRLPREPDEERWDWQGTNVHLDRLDAKNAPLKVVVLHGGGGNGRLLSAFGALVYGLGYSYVAPDLPGFGLTVPGPDYDSHYRSWVALAADLVAAEQARDDLPVVTFGGSLGGMLAYNTAAASGEVRGIIATTLADPRDVRARDALAANRLWSRLGIGLMKVVPALTDRLRIPARMISGMERMTNDPDFSRLFIKDPLVGGTRIDLRFYRSMTVYEPRLAPEEFDLCPLLLAHPTDDKWTPVEVSLPFFDRFGGEKELIMLDGCGHLPYEEPGVSQFREAVGQFLAGIARKTSGRDAVRRAG